MNTALFITFLFTFVNSLYPEPDSYYNLRINSDVIKRMMEYNIHLFFNRTEHMNIDDVPLPELNTKLTDVKVAIRHETTYESGRDFELFVEEPNSFTIEIHNLKYLGRGFIEDPETKAKEKLNLKVPINTA